MVGSVGHIINIYFDINIGVFFCKFAILCARGCVHNLLCARARVPFDATMSVCTWAPPDGINARVGSRALGSATRANYLKIQLTT